MGDVGISTRSAWLRFISLVAVVVVVAGGALVVAQVRSSSKNQVAWLDERASPSLLQSLLPKPLPIPPAELGAADCTAGDLSVVTVESLGITQDDGVSISLRNDGSTTCLLRGTPRVVARAPGHASVFASDNSLPSFGEITDTAPGGTVLIWIHAPEACPAYPGGVPSSSPEYQDVTISVPSGGSFTVTNLHLPGACGLSTTPFFTMTPQPTYPNNPLVELVPRLRLPATVEAGTTLTYSVTLTNSTDRNITLSPCPAYLENSTLPTKFEYRLNCSTVRAIPARGHITYQMEMALPQSAQSGGARIGWTLFGASTISAHGEVRVVH